MEAANVTRTSTPIPRPGRGGRLPSLLTLNVSNMSEVEARDNLDILDLSEWTAAEQVNLSLNKKGRWKMLSALKENINKNQFQGEDFHVHVIERFWLNRKSNCDEIVSNKEGVRGSGKSRFVTADTLLYGSKPRAKSKRVKRSKGKLNEETGDKSRDRSDSLPQDNYESTQPELRVEVVKPFERCVPGTPVTSRRRRERLQRKKKTAKSHKGQHVVPKRVLSDWGVEQPISENWPNNQEKHRKIKKTEDIVPVSSKPPLPSLADWNSDILYDLDLDCLVEEEKDLETPEENQTGCRVPNCLADFLAVPRNKLTKKRCSDNKRKPSPSKKGKVVYTTKSDSPNVETEKVASAEPEVEQFCVSVKFKDEDISPSSLTALFGDRYLECACVPRRFLLDFTGCIRETHDYLQWARICYKQTKKHRRKFYTYFKNVQKDVKTAGYLVMEEQHDGKYRVTFETDAEVDLETWKQKIEEKRLNVSPQELAERLCELFRGKIEKKAFTPDEYGNNCPTYSTLKNMLSWPEAESYFSSPFPAVLADRKQVTVQSVPIGDCCNICYDVIDMSSRDKQGLALAECGHWFCIVCWKHHVTTSVKNGSTNVYCPEFDCKACVDEGTLTSLLTMSDLRVYRSRLDDIVIGSDQSKLYCPRPGCTRIVTVHQLAESQVPGCVQCKCGAVFCVECRGHAHWPADCSHLKKYQENQITHGDENMMSWTADNRNNVRGKRCPECNYFIEKNEGCPMMTCICGHGFCWQCSKPSDGHGYDPICYQKSDNQGTKKLQEVYIEDLTVHPQSRSRAYVLSMRSRIRQQQHRQLFSNHVTKMKKELKGLFARQKLMDQRRIQIPRENYSRRLRKMSNTLEETENKQGMHMLDWIHGLVFEIHHVIEYGAVLIDIHKQDPRLSNTGSLVSSLVYLVSRMEQVLEEGVEQKMIMVPTKLMKLTDKATRVLMDLRALTNHYPSAPEQTLIDNKGRR